ncbi:MAG: carboxypeptidase regulatory-like domain-containing protein [Anaerolineaceae bacterium]|nr:carboxypeptidase regulatory-like domain-containing protein [Anaerolineaceae bacterium]
MPKERLGFKRCAETALLSLLALAALSAGGKQALAHRVNIYAWSEAGSAIRGEAYFPGGGKAKNATVEVFAPGGRKLGETKTDDAGQFTFQARYRCDHKFVANLGDGHGATYVLKADELPAALPALSGTTTAAEGAEPQPKPVGPQRAAAAVPEAPPSEVQRLVEQAVSRQVVPLRRQIRTYEEKVRFRDILGGIGYIVGLAGIVFYFKAAAKAGTKRKQ